MPIGFVKTSKSKEIVSKKRNHLEFFSINSMKNQRQIMHNTINKFSLIKLKQYTFAAGSTSRSKDPRRAFRSEQYFFRIKNEGNMINEVNIEFITNIP
jgi:hypothetical protein